MTRYRGRLTVQGHGTLEDNKRPPRGDMFDKSLVNPGTLLFQEADMHLDSGRPQQSNAIAADLGIGIDHSDKHPAHPGLDKGFGAGRSLTEMAARLQGYIDIGIPRLFSRPEQGVHLRMRRTCLPMPSFADNRFPLHNDTAD